MGLTAAEVAERIARGEVNRAPHAVWREYGQIVARNLFTWFNAMVMPAALALFFLGEIQGGIAVSGMAIVNSSLGLFQEVRARRHLDKLRILTETRVRVRRDGAVQEVPASNVVLGDHILIRSGESVVADGSVLDSHFLEVDEALLTGESDPVRRQPGDRLLSGSFCVAGEGEYRADKVGPKSFAQQTAAEARRYHQTASPLTVVINRVVQVLTYTAVGLIFMYSVAYVVQGFPETDRQQRQRQRDFVRMVAATITSMVPQGLVLTATMAFSLGAIVMSRRGAVVQRLNAVETMAAIDVICTDKTGTLTTNHLRLEAILVLDSALDEGTVRRRIQLFASASVDQQNRNIQALRRSLGGAPVESLDQLPFKSQNRYSAVRMRDEGRECGLVMGAVESLREYVERWEELQPNRRISSELPSLLRDRQQMGQRLLLFGELTEPISLANSTSLPLAPLRPLALICLGDELRPDARQVVEALAAQGIDFKIISGDNPETVRGTIRQIRLPLADTPVVSGQELKESANRVRLIQERSVFGRVTPEQKVEIVETLRTMQRRVAMIGDGVNDVLPIKKADLGIAMGEGSQASKIVAGLVLENNNFSLLPDTLEEGRLIVRNLRRSAKLFLVKNVYSLILILAYSTHWFGIPFPYVPQQVTLLNWLVIGLPAIVIALSRERSTRATKNNFLIEVGWFALRTGIVFGIAGVVILVLARSMDHDARYSRTMLLSTLILLGITALLRALRDGNGETLKSDTRFQLLGGLAVPVYLLAMYWPLPAQFFELRALRLLDWGVVMLVVAVAYLITLASDRLLNLPLRASSAPIQSAPAARPSPPDI